MMWRPGVRRFACLLAGVWSGVMLGIAAIAAPSGFALLPLPIAGQLAGRMFAAEAHWSLAVCVVLLLLTWRQAQADLKADGEGSVLSGNLVLVLAVLFCTLFGYFGLQPMMLVAKAGQGALPFGVLHGVSVGFFVGKGLLCLALAWRLTECAVRFTLVLRFLTRLISPPAAKR
jgi:hypothetical protein